MCLHLTARFAWHDSGWDGKICRDPAKNIYCNGNFSLLSSRIQRRKDVELEKQYAGRFIDELPGDYVPPCYWVLNALGSKRYGVKHVHPFCDFSDEARRGIEPIDDVLEPYAIFTWCFKFSFTRGGLTRYPRDLEKRLEHYLSYVVPGRSLVIFYCNYSNPVNGDRNRYLILGAALIRDVKRPKRYVFDSQYYAKLKERYGHFPEIDWAFQVVLDPDSIVVIPYHSYLERMRRARSEEERRRLEQMLEEIIVEVDNKSIEPFFKYVSMHISTDNALYILYKICNSLFKARKHGVADGDLLDEYLNRAEKLVAHLWAIRGRFPSLKKALLAILKLTGHPNFFVERSEDYENYREWERYAEMLLEKYGDDLARILEKGDVDGVEALLSKVSEDKLLNRNCYVLLHFFKNFVSNYSNMLKLLKILCSMDLSYIQMLNILKKIMNKELDIAELSENPYSLVYRYVPQNESLREWFIEFMDPGVSLHIVDIAFIPDSRYVDRLSDFPSNYSGRIIAAIHETLLAEAMFNGVTAVTEDKLLELMTKRDVLRLYSGAPSFVSKSDIERLLADFKDLASGVLYHVDDLEHGRIFQLKILRLLEKDVEDIIKKMLKKKYDLNDDVASLIDELVNSEFEGLRNLNIPGSQKKDYIALRRNVYRKSIENGLLVIKGSAGTGKTEAIVNLVKLFSSMKIKPIFVLTPTGKSALVIESRLKERGLAKECYVATIHRFLYSYYFDIIEGCFASSTLRSRFFELVDLIDKAMSDVRWFIDFRKYISTDKGLKIHPKVVIVDEASMVDELVLTLLLNVIDVDGLEHLIIVGDYNQLPPIGLGKPFIDIVNYLEENDYHENIVSLDVPVRFSVNTGIWAFSQVFASAGKTVVDPETYVDNTLEVHFFESEGDLEAKLREIFQTILGRECLSHYDLLDILNEILELKLYDPSKGLSPKLEYLQILTPTRYGELGSDYVNKVVIMNNRDVRECSFVKIINEQNRYVKLEHLGRELVLANGSMGYWDSYWNKGKGMVFFEEISETSDRLKAIHSSRRVLKRLLNQLKSELVGSLKDEVYVSPSYAITVHKSQGSDFDYVIFIVPRVSGFVSRELFYTALTRAKRKLFLLLNANLKSKMSQMLQQVVENSEIDRRTTLLFKYREYSTRTYSLRLDNGTVIHLRSKVEYMIADALKSLGIEFEYEPRDFVEHGVIPDFKIKVDDRVYYVEHLGLLDREVYRSRWNIKRRIYERLGLMDCLITVSEPEEGAIDVKSVLAKIVDDIRSGRLREVESGYPSKHHYVLASND